VHICNSNNNNINYSIVSSVSMWNEKKVVSGFSFSLLEHLENFKENINPDAW